jgi:hypothetical protein
MTGDEIIRMAREAGFPCLSADESTDEMPHIYGGDLDGNIYPLIERLIDLATYDERINMKIDGWRQCAKGQRTTQFCGQLEVAVAAEREACAMTCEQQGKGRKALEHYAALTYSGSAHDCAAAIRARCDP